MSWWEETEARARRSKGSAQLFLTLQQRMLSAGLEPDLSTLPAFDLAQLNVLCTDLVLLVDGLLIVQDGDLPALRRQAYLLQRWAELSHRWTVTTAPSFNRLLDSLDLEPDLLSGRGDSSGEPSEVRLPQEEGKRGGRYRHWHLLYERLDLKLASAGLPEEAGRGLARSLARLYEEALILVRSVWHLEKESHLRFRQLARLLLEVNTTWHFDLGPNHLGLDSVSPTRTGAPGFQTWLFLTFGNQGYPSGAKP